MNSSTQEKRLKWLMLPVKTVTTIKAKIKYLNLGVKVHDVNLTYSGVSGSSNNNIHRSTFQRYRSDGRAFAISKEQSRKFSRRCDSRWLSQCGLLWIQIISVSFCTTANKCLAGPFFILPVSNVS